MIRIKNLLKQFSRATKNNLKTENIFFLFVAFFFSSFALLSRSFLGFFQARTFSLTYTRWAWWGQCCYGRVQSLSYIVAEFVVDLITDEQDGDSFSSGEVRRKIISLPVLELLPIFRRAIDKDVYLWPAAFNQISSRVNAEVAKKKRRREVLLTRRPWLFHINFERLCD